MSLIMTQYFESDKQIFDIQQGVPKNETIKFFDFGPYFAIFWPSDDSNTLQTPN